MNFAIIGCGMIGKSTAKCFKKLPEDKLAAVFDRTYDRAKALADEHGVQKIYTDYDDVLNDAEIEAVILCTASHVHAEQAIRAIRAGKAVACEKPLDVTVEKELEIIEAAREHNAKVQCLYQRRCIPAVRAARDAVARGEIGEICLAEARLKYYRDQHYYDEAPWRSESGGVVLNQGIHGIDMILWMLGRPAVEVKAVKGTLGHEAGCEDTAAAVITLEGGGILTINATTCAYGEDRTEFALHGTRGSITFELSGPAEQKLKDREKAALPTGEYDGVLKDPWNGDFHAWLLRDLALAVKEDRQPFIPPEEVLESTRVAQLMLSR